MAIDLNEPIRKSDSPKVRRMKLSYQKERGADGMLVTGILIGLTIIVAKVYCGL